MTEPRPLKTLYELLWEQIKDQQYVTFLMSVTSEMEIKGIITRQEENILDDSLFENRNTELKRKAFVQRMIKELTIKE